MRVDDCILILNAGSSSLKFGVFGRPEAASWRLETRGRIDGLGTSPRLVATGGLGEVFVDRPLDREVHDAAGALDVLSGWLRSQYRGVRVAGVGHRVVHGGPRDGPTLLTPSELADLRALAPMAPLHQPHSLAAVEAVWQQLPDVPQVACFDTSFHRGRPAVAELVPLPLEIRRAGAQRYGFHGLSYEYIASVLPEVAPEIAPGAVVVAHLGSGASLCAMQDGRSVDSTMGFSALDGLCMGTRPGSVDPGLLLYLLQGLRLTVHEIESLLYERSGLLGISGISNDMRELLRRAEPGAELAVDYFVYRAAQEIAAMAAALGGMDGLIFTGGIGEHAVEIRYRICQACRWLGLEVDPQANLQRGPRISQAGSRISAWVIPTNEELVIARHTGRLLGLAEAPAHA